MSRRDPFTPELLSAYLDGELSLDERREIEQLLSESAEHRQYVQQLRRLSERLQELPIYQLGNAFTDRVLRETAQHNTKPAPAEPESEFSDELLSAYLDGELSPQRQRDVAAWLAASDERRQALSELQALRDGLSLLPSYRLDDGFAERVLHRAEQEPSRPAAEAPLVTPARPAATEIAGRTGRRRHRVVWSVLAAAAVLLLALHLPWIPSLVGPEVATIEPGTVQPETGTLLDEKPVAEPPARVLADSERNPRRPAPLPQPEFPPIPPAREAIVGPSKPSPAPKAGNDQWALVSLMRRQSQQRLLLVYEIQVTPEGLENAALANLLRRHQIGLQQTVAIGPGEQMALLRQRFLQGVEIGGADRADMDKIQLYLVACTGRQADAMMFDLLARPKGIGSFFINLTTQDTEGGDLGRLCDAHRPSGDGSVAVQLLADFAILSRTARSLGMFGGIRWVDPTILKGPPKPPTADALPAASRQPPPAAIGGDLRCELLLVVRNLKPILDTPPQP